MATSSKTSDEKPIQTSSTEQQSPIVDDLTEVAKKEEGEVITPIENVDEEFGNSTDIWKAEKAGEGYFVPLLIWCASVLFPLCAGSFGPMSSAFGVFAVAESWRVENVTKAADNMLVGTAVEDPKW
jgi:potassium channel subfamily K